jgi:hypothetical protein
MRLSELLNPTAITTRLKARTKREAIAELVDLLESAHGLSSHGEILDRVLRREAMMSRATAASRSHGRPHGGPAGGSRRVSPGVWTSSRWTAKGPRLHPARRPRARRMHVVSRTFHACSRRSRSASASRVRQPQVFLAPKSAESVYIH